MTMSDNWLKLGVNAICSAVLSVCVICGYKYMKSRLNAPNNLQSNTSLEEKLRVNNKKPVEPKSRESDHSSFERRCLVDVHHQQLKNGCWIASTKGFLRFYSIKESSSDVKTFYNIMHYNPERSIEKFPKCCRRSIKLDYFDPKDDLAMIRMKHEYKGILVDILNKDRNDLPELPGDEDIRKFYQEIAFVSGNKGKNCEENLVHFRNIIGMLEGKEYNQNNISVEQMNIIKGVLRRGKAMLKDNKIHFDRTSDVAAMEFLERYNKETKFMDIHSNPKEWSCTTRRILKLHIEADIKAIGNIVYFINNILNSTDGEISDVVKYINQKAKFKHGVKLVEIVPEEREEMIYPDQLFEVIKREMNTFEEPEPMIFVMGGHFIVIEDIDEKNGRIYYADPASNENYIHQEKDCLEFFRYCMSVSYNYLSKYGNQGFLNMYSILSRRVDENDKDITAYQG